MSDGAGQDPTVAATPPSLAEAKRRLLEHRVLEPGAGSIVARWPIGAAIAACALGVVLARSPRARREALPIILAALRRG
ncbi:MAG: hypothetical protein JNM80_09005 [Phycisphaerae bacterium]|nr:hypothetical protein [Phycisphaerae bacterium]